MSNENRHLVRKYIDVAFQLRGKTPGDWYCIGWWLIWDDGTIEYRTHVIPEPLHARSVQDVVDDMAKWWRTWASPWPRQSRVACCPMTCAVPPMHRGGKHAAPGDRRYLTRAERQEVRDRVRAVMAERRK
jgi:hypothetical protein